MVGETGMCNKLMGQYPVRAGRETPFTQENVEALRETFFPCLPRSSVCAGDRYIHMSDMPGIICVQDLDPTSNSTLAEEVSALCSSEALNGDPHASEKCDALHRAIESKSMPPEIFSLAWFKKMIPHALVGLGVLIVSGLVIGAGFVYAGHRLPPWLTKRDVAKAAKKDDPNKKDGPGKDDPPSGGSGVTEAKVAEAPQTVEATSPVAESTSAFQAFEASRLAYLKPLFPTEVQQGWLAELGAGDAYVPSFGASAHSFISPVFVPSVTPGGMPVFSPVRMPGVRIPSFRMPTFRMPVRVPIRVPMFGI